MAEVTKRKSQKRSKGPGPIAQFAETANRKSRTSIPSLTSTSSPGVADVDDATPNSEARISATIDLLHLVDVFKQVQTSIKHIETMNGTTEKTEMVERMEHGINTLNAYIVLRLTKDALGKNETTRRVEEHFASLKSSDRTDDFTYAQYINKTFISEADRQEVVFPMSLNEPLAPIPNYLTEYDQADEEIMRKLTLRHSQQSCSDTSTLDSALPVESDNTMISPLHSGEGQHDWVKTEEESHPRSKTMTASWRTKKAHTLNSTSRAVGSEIEWPMRRGVSARNATSYVDKDKDGWNGAQQPIPVFSVGCDVLLSDLSHWTLDVFDLTNNSGGRPLTALGMRIFEDFDLICTFNIAPLALCKFFMAVEDAYGRYPDVCYHNNQHAADVLFSTQCLLRHKAVRSELTKLEILSTLLAATLHDVQHPGLDAGFLIATNHNLSLTYNDKSILENHHASFGSRILNNEKCDILSNMTKVDKADCRKMMITMILSTDMSSHFGGVIEFEKLAKAKHETPANEETKPLPKTSDGFGNKDVKTLLCSLLHCADLGASTKDWAYSKQWAFRVISEFWEQGDKEKGNALPVGPLNDREKTNIPRSQINFINIIVQPLWQCWSLYIDDANCVQLQNLDRNRERWRKVDEEEEPHPREQRPSVVAVRAKETDLSKEKRKRWTAETEKIHHNDNDNNNGKIDFRRSSMYDNDEDDYDNGDDDDNDDDADNDNDDDDDAIHASPLSPRSAAMGMRKYSQVVEEEEDGTQIDLHPSSTKSVFHSSVSFNAGKKDVSANSTTTTTTTTTTPPPTTTTTTPPTTTTTTRTNSNSTTASNSNMIVPESDCNTSNTTPDTTTPISFQVTTLRRHLRRSSTRQTTVV